jgi:hypothetical protein
VPLSRVGLTSAIALALLFARSSAAADEPTKQACVEANESAQDLQRASKLVEAREQLRTCAERACPRAVRQDCTERLVAIERALPTVVLAPKDGAGGPDLRGAALAVDGAARSDALDGTPIPVNPGSHTFTVTFAGRSPMSLRIDLKEGDAVQREVVLKPLHSTGKGEAKGDDASDAEVPVTGLDDRGAAPPATRREAREGRAHTQGLLRIAGWSALGVGGAGIALGSIFGILALGKNSSLASACGTRTCQATSVEQYTTLQSEADGVHFDGVAANISFGVGILGLGAGVTMLVLASEAHSPDASGAPPSSPPSSVRARPWVGLGHAGVAGSFP